MKQLVRYPTDKAWHLFPTLEAVDASPELQAMLDELVTAYSFSSEPLVFFVVADDELTTIAEYSADGWPNPVGELVDAEVTGVLSEEVEIFGNFDDTDDYEDPIDWEKIDKDDDDFDDDYTFGEDDEFDEDEDYFDEDEEYEDDETRPDEPDQIGYIPGVDYFVDPEEDET